MKIRKLKKGDVKQVALLRLKLFLKWDAMDPIDKIDRKYFKSQKHYAFLKKWIADKKRLTLVTEDNGKITAFIMSTITVREPFMKTVCYLGEIWVEPKYRKKGITTEFIKQTKKWFSKHKIKWVIVSTHSLDKQANKFWKGRGFKEFNKIYKMKN
ncbi:MAG: GNAT family N-acetyltransferase [Nanoarchaeota archaeon]|nr:GNAT family N-acetyltransferase [Nanoarchaeota archaeon]